MSQLKPALRIYLLGVMGAGAAATMLGLLAGPPVLTRHAAILMTLLASLAAARSMVRSAIGLDERMLQTVKQIADTADARHPYLAGTSQRVAELAERVARARGLSDDDCRRITLAARLHDVAAALLPGYVELGAGGVYDEHQRFFWNNHSVEGAEIVHNVLGLHAVAEAIRYHHERIDGAGYPDRLAGVSIPLDSRIIAVCEGWVALTSNRGYREALSEENALFVLQAGAGTHWDRNLVQIVAEIVRGEGAMVPAVSRRRSAAGRTAAAAIGA